NTHTLNIPMASTASVTAGLLSKTDYDAFNTKQTNALASGSIWVGNSSGGAQARAISGDITSVSNTGSVVAKKTTTGASSTILSLDGSGIANFFGAGLLGSTSGTITVRAPATTPNYTVTSPHSAGSSGQVLSTDGIGTT